MVEQFFIVVCHLETGQFCDSVFHTTVICVVTLSLSAVSVPLGECWCDFSMWHEVL